MITVIIKLILWIGAMGTLLSNVFEPPAFVNTDFPYLWALFLGCVGTFVVRPVAQFFWTFLKNAIALYKLFDSLPTTKADANKLGIVTPVDFAMYMSTHQIFRFERCFQEPKLCLLTKSPFLVKGNYLFQTMFGRDPFSEVEADIPIEGTIRLGGAEIMCSDLRGFWGACVWPEAAQLANKPMEELTDADIQALLYKNRESKDVVMADVHWEGSHVE